MRLAVIGHPIAHSLSPRLHQSWLEAAGRFGRYEALDVTSDDLSELFARVRAGEYDGLNVTIPHKEAVIAFLDELDEPARQAGAVNTVYKRDGRLVGTNTDGSGFIDSLSGLTDFSGETLVIGAGGAARGIVAAWPNQRVTILNRTRKKAETLAAEFGCAVAAEPLDLSRFAHIIQTTSVGMDGTSTPLALTGISPGAVVCDIIYRPRETAFLREAKRNGAVTCDGVGMFVGQAARSFEYWTGVRPDVKAGKRLIEQLLEES